MEPLSSSDPPPAGDLRPAGTSAPADAIGELYVLASRSGGLVRVDGRDTGQRTPAMLRGVAAGYHLVEVELGCERARAEITVVPGAIARVELALVDVPGRLLVQGEPVGAIVRVDGAEVGPLPWDGKVRCGAHRVDVSADGYLRSRAPVEVAAGGAAAVEVQLVREQPGTLTVDVSPLDARVSVDGRLLGEGPRTVGGVAPGPHAIEATREGYRPGRAAITLDPGGTARVELVLTPGRTPSAGPRRKVATGVAAAGLAAGAWSAWEFATAERAYQAFLMEPNNQEAAALFQEEVRPHETRAWVAAGTSTAALLGAGAIWVAPWSGGVSAGIGGTF